MTFPLTIDLVSSEGRPVAGATCIITPDGVNPTASGTVITTASGVTDANGHLTLNVLPSTVNTFYIIRFNKDNIANVINPFRFQMPPQATSLTSLFQGAVNTTGRVPEGVLVQFPTQPFSRNNFPSFTDTDIPVADAAFTFGDWVDVYHMTNNSEQTANYLAFFDLIFDPDWAYDPGDRAEVDLRLRHVDSDGTLIRELQRHNFDYIRNLDDSHSKGSIQATGLAELTPGQYIEVDVRGGRQQPASARATDRTIKLIGAESTLQVKRETPITPATVRITVDPATMTGTGSTASPVKPLNPFTTQEKNKLAAIPANAQPNPSTGDIISAFEAQPEAQKLSYNTGLKDKPTLDIPNNLGDLDDVVIANPADDQVVTYKTAKFRNLPPHELQLGYAQIAGVLQAHKLPRTFLSGETTVGGGTTLPAVASVAPFTLFVKQDSTADNPGLYLAGATYDVPLRDRNRVVLSVDSNGLYSINPQRGSSTDNYDHFVGTYSARARSGQGQITIALYHDPNPPTTFYIRGIGSSTGVITVTRSGPGLINGRTYSVYSATVAAALVQNAPNTTQMLTFFTDAAGTTPYNIKPATEHHAKAWHLQSPVPPDYAVTDSRSPAYIRNKPEPTTIGRLIAKTAALPTASTAFSPAGTISRYSPTLGITDAEVTTNYTVAGNSVASVGAYPKQQVGWLVRALIADTERCRVFIPLSPTRPYSSPASILDDTRVCGHTYFGVSGTVNYYLGYQLSIGNQDRPAGTGNTATNIEIIVAANLASASVTFPSLATIEVREAVVG